jgi:uncharacterized Zn finger protein
VIDALLRDPFDLCPGAVEILEQPYPQEAWSRVADDLLGRLSTSGSSGQPGQLPHNFGRESLAYYAVMALKKAGRDAEVIPLWEREAVQNTSYQRLVTALLEAGRPQEAEQWARKGIGATQQQYPGIANQLREVVCTLQAESGNWPMVAAFRAEEFFTGPTLQSFRALEAAAVKAGVGPEVRAGMLAFLETGQLPQRSAQVVGGRDIPAWPLPKTGLPQLERHYPLQFPQVGLLITLAATEDRPADVLYWYDRRSAGRSFQINDDMVADAVAQAYPERAAGIWKQLAEARIAQTNPAAYQEAAVFLRKLRQVWLRQGKAGNWRTYVNDLRTANRRKRRLIETLDSLLSEAK